MYTVSCERHFDAGHSLPSLPPEHKCHGIHGHSYRVVVEVSATELNEHGFVMDYADIKEVLDEVIYRLDHKYLNDLFDHPSTEVIAEFIFEQMIAELEGTTSVTVYETPGNACRYAP